MEDPPRETRSTCPYCGVGCGVLIESRGDRITGVRGDPTHPANFGRLCSKGATLHLTAAEAVTRQARLLQPMQRLHRAAAPQPVHWDAALDLAAERFASVIDQHGPDAVGFYISGQLLTEDYFVFNQLAKGLVGTNNLDSNSRLCMSSAVAGYKQTLGADAPPACYEDLEHAGCVFITGSNAAWAHPVLFRRLEDARRANPRLRIVVVDPRRTDTCEIADLHLAIQPGSDVMLCHGLLHLMLWEGWTDNAFIAAHTEGFDALKALVRDATPARVAQLCGITPEDLLRAARLFALGGAEDVAQRAPTLSLWCQGLNQSRNGTANNAALINLHLASGQIGKPGAGPFSLTGQPNAMGGREVGGMANLLPGHRDPANAAHRAEVAALWGIDALPERPGKTAVEMFQAAADGEIRALWICCTNPAQSLPDQALVRRALQRAEFVVVQEAFATTATCDYADLLLPATSWGEKEGTVTNSERRISRVRPAVPPPGQTRHDWQIVGGFARRLAARLGRGGTSEADGVASGRAGLADFDSAESIWNAHRESTRGRDLDITGLSWDLLEHQGPQQWPMPQGAACGSARLYTDHRFATPDGRARFVATPWRGVAEARDARHPFALTSGRLRDQWHGMSRSGTLGRLFGHAPEPALEMHPQDIARRGLAPGALVRVGSRRGSLVLPLQASETLTPGLLHIAMHWGGEFLGGSDAEGVPRAGVNQLTTPAFCPVSRQPELKHAAVRVEAVELPWQLLALAWLPAERVLQVREQLRALLPAFAFASCVPFAQDSRLEDAAGAPSGLLLRAAASQAPAPELLARIEACLALDGDDVLRYDDPRRAQHRRMRRVADDPGPQGDLRLEGFLLAGDTRAGGWIAELLRQRADTRAFGRLLLSASAEAPEASLAGPVRGKAVCTCLNVTQEAIVARLETCDAAPEERLADLQRTLSCGTNCGSCVPELKRLVRITPARVPAGAA